jgi:lipopolysaccharide/colanic/teichoic acid biosynthesis glycosyltransferase
MVRDAHKLLRTDPKLKEFYDEYKKNSFKLEKDPRVTKVGELLRKMSIDELPQFFNVLKGQMSLVGPRAYYPDELEENKRKYPKTLPFIEESLKVKPGITGLWQVSGRSKIGFEKRIVMDANYASKNSIWLDLKILLKTPFVVLKRDGVY